MDTIAALAALAIPVVFVAAMLIRLTSRYRMLRGDLETMRRAVQNLERRVAALRSRREYQDAVRQQPVQAPLTWVDEKGVTHHPLPQGMERMQAGGEAVRQDRPDAGFAGQGRPRGAGAGT